MHLPSRLDHPPDPPPLGLILLKADQTLEREALHWLGEPTPAFHVSRIMSGDEATPESLSAMREGLVSAASLLPNIEFASVGYACTSASALIGSAKVSELIRQGCQTRHVTDPMTALVALARDLGVTRFALISPYVEDVNEPLRAALAKSGVSTDIFGTFNTPREADVARISTQSIVESAIKLGRQSAVDAVFLSCTNLRTQTAIPVIEAAINKPVLSSNSALLLHMTHLQRQMPRLAPDSTL